MSTRTRLGVALWAVALVAFGLLYWWNEAELAPLLREQVETAMARQLGLAAEAASGASFSDSLAERLGDLSASRITLYDLAGRPLGDSDVSADRVAEAESGGAPPEVLEALRAGTGRSTRRSSLNGQPYLFVALRSEGGVLRAARSLATTDAPLLKARRFLLVGAAITLLLCLVATPVAASVLLRPLRRVRRTTEAIAGGDLQRRFRPEGADEVASLGRAIDGLADRLQEQVEELRRESAELDALFDSLEDGVAVVSRDGIVLRANRAFERWVGGRSVRGERFATLFRDPIIVGLVQEGGSDSHSRETRVGERTLLFNAQPRGDEVLVVVRDLTRMRQLEGIRRDFVANVSHELKTPLTSVMGFAEALEEPDLDPEHRREFADRILHNVERMRRLVDDLLDLSRIESGAWSPRSESLDPLTVAREVWSSLQPRADERQVRLVLSEPPVPPVHADREALGQILRNLLENAIQYSPPGAAVRVDVRKGAGGTTIRVSDEGPGIPTAHQERVFERFYRMDTARSRAAGGTGLGLSIVKHLVAAHGGRVGIESEPGQGTTVWLTLPSA